MGCNVITQRRGEALAEEDVTVLATLALVDPDLAGVQVHVGDEPGRPFLYHFTSGTTGSAKVVLFSAAQFFRWALTLSQPLGSTAADRQAPAQFWPEKGGLRDLVRIQLVGGTFVNAAFPETRQELANLIDNFGVTQLAASPWQLRRLLHSETPPGLRLRPLRVLSVGGAAILPQEVLACRATITPNVYVTYGSNEIGMIACLRPEDGATRAGRVGKPIASVAAQAVDDEHRPVPAGTVGNLRFRAAGMTQAYVGNAAATANSFQGAGSIPATSARSTPTDT